MAGWAIGLSFLASACYNSGIRSLAPVPLSESVLIATFGGVAFWYLCRVPGFSAQYDPHAHAVTREHPW